MHHHLHHYHNHHGPFFLPPKSPNPHGPFFLPPKSPNPHGPLFLPPKSPNPLSSRSMFFAILDFAFYTAVIFAACFLIFCWFKYFSHTLPLVVPPYYVSQFHSTIDYWTSARRLRIACYVILSICGMAFIGQILRRCGIDGCRGLVKAPEFDLLLLSKDTEVRDLELEEVPLKGEGPRTGFYECLYVELRRLAPTPDGRAVLLFCKDCGCPASKIVVLKKNTVASRRFYKNKDRRSGSEQ